MGNNKKRSKGPNAKKPRTDAEEPVSNASGAAGSAGTSQDAANALGAGNTNPEVIAPRPLTRSFADVAAAGAAGRTSTPLPVPNVDMTDRTASPAQDDSADYTADQSGENQ